MAFKRMRKLALPLVGLAAAGALVVQVRGATSEAPPAAAIAEPRLESSSIRAEGRVTTYPGAQVTVSTEREGLLSSLRVDEKSVVRKGEVVAELDAGEQQAALREARAQLREAQAELRLAKIDAERYGNLLAEGAVSRQQAEQARRDAETALARQAAAQARVEKLRAQTDKSVIRSPIDGVVIARMAQPGEVIDAGAPLVTIADITHSRIEAEVDEFDLGRVSLGSPVTVQAEGFQGMGWKGHIEEIPDTVSPRRLKPQDPGRPQDTRVLLVKVALDEPTPLKLGQRVEVNIDSAERVSPAPGAATTRRGALEHGRRG